MKIKALVLLSSKDGYIQPGEIIEIEDERGLALIGSGAAEEILESRPSKKNKGSNSSQETEGVNGENSPNGEPT